jgi:hypothetical protein
LFFFTLIPFFILLLINKTFFENVFSQMKVEESKKEMSGEEMSGEEMSGEEISGEEISGEEMGRGRNIRERNGSGRTDYIYQFTNLPLSVCVSLKTVK